MKRLLVLFLCLWLPLQGIAATALATKCAEKPGVGHGTSTHAHGLSAAPEVLQGGDTSGDSSTELPAPAQDCCHHLSAAMPLAIPALFGPPSPRIEPIALDPLPSFISELPKRPPLAAL